MKSNNQTQIEDRDLHRDTAIIKYGIGKGDDGWWNTQKMVEQTQRAITVFNCAFTGDIAVFAFNNSSGHALFSWCLSVSADGISIRRLSPL